ncbi:putative uncharacterized protein [Firmicutes bacterium CAG:83]|nr:putative uncharacterized protein [Firmicutes bacterium CAG:83]
MIHNLFKIQAGSGFQNLDNTSKKRYHKVTKFEEVNHLMEKKGTRIAYFVALAIVVIALVIAKVANDGSGFVATGWALFPPVVAIALALISKEVYSSLFLGCVVGALLLANFQPWQMVVNFVGAGEGVGMINAIDISILIFLVILGIMVDLMNKAGGSAAFGRWAKKAVKTRSGAQLLTMLLGVLIFIDDYFNCLTVGAVMRPVTESHKISRAKLAYVIDATAAPVCMLAPVSSWAALPCKAGLHHRCHRRSRLYAGSRVLLGRCRCILRARWLPRLPYQHVPEPDPLQLLLHPDAGDGHRHLPAEH